MVRSGTAVRVISWVAIVLALSACADGGFDSGRRRFSGVWLYEFEGSTFVEGATRMPARRPDYRETDWLEWRDWPELERLMEAQLIEGDCYTVQPFLLTFVGRKTHHPFSGAGHMSQHRSKVTMERPISVRRLGPSVCYDE